MRAVKRWRYYCDFCKKAGGQKYAMAKHERTCTMNPERECGLCAIVDEDQVPVSVLKTLVVAVPTEKTVYNPFDGWSDLTDESFNAICEAANNCPACILAVMRQTETRHNKFDFKKELASFWSSYNDDNHEGSYYP